MSTSSYENISCMNFALKCVTLNDFVIRFSPTTISILDSNSLHNQNSKHLVLNENSISTIFSALQTWIAMLELYSVHILWLFWCVFFSLWSSWDLTLFREVVCPLPISYPVLRYNHTHKITIVSFPGVPSTTPLYIHVYMHNLGIFGKSTSSWQQPILVHK